MLLSSAAHLQGLVGSLTSRACVAMPVVQGFQSISVRKTGESEDDVRRCVSLAAVGIKMWKVHCFAFLFRLDVCQNCCWDTLLNPDQGLKTVD
jgi:hypothetical protein